MNAIAEIDKAGRLVVPKRLREALHLVPGTRLLLHKEGDSIVLQPEPKPGSLSLKSGILVYDSGPATHPDAIDWIDEDRTARMQQAAGDWIKL